MNVRREVCHASPSRHWGGPRIIWCGPSSGHGNFPAQSEQPMSTAQGHYRAGVETYNSVPMERRLDYRCNMGDMRPCYVRQQQLNNANEYMACHYRSLGRSLIVGTTGGK